MYGVSYRFTEFGPKMTTVVMPSELYPVDMRATGHGISAGIGKFGAFIGVFLFPVLNSSLGLRGTLLLTTGVSVAGMALTFVLPEPAGAAWKTCPPAARARPPAAARHRFRIASGGINLPLGWQAGGSAARPWPLPAASHRACARTVCEAS